MPSLREHYPTLDLAKFLLSFVIVGIHTEIFCQFGLLDMGFGVISRMAVPFFFTASAFLFFRKPPTRARYWSFSKRILILLAIYSALIFATAPITGTKVMGGSVIGFLLLTLYSGFRHLWFLHALIFGMLCLALCLKYLPGPRAVYGTAGACLAFRWSLSTLWPIFEGIPALDAIHGFFLIPETTGIWNAIFYAFPFLALGHAIANRKHSHALRTNLFGIGISLITLAVESYLAASVLHSTSVVIFLSCAPLVYFTLSACLQTHWPTHQPVCVFMRRSSTLIYCVHPCFVVALMLILPKGLMLFAAVSMAAMTFACFVHWGTHKPWGRWMKYLQ